MIMKRNKARLVGEGGGGMDITRRQFLLGGGAAAAGLAISGKSANARDIDTPELRIKGLKVNNNRLSILCCGMRDDRPR